MSTAIATAAVSMERALALQSAQMSMLKQQHQSEMSLVGMLEDATQAVRAASEGQGAAVDRLA